ncbi:hypothetical protein TRFO_24311 [Tritrichomonas foetus]|uniref:Uncharacterized protein n=1 Tax=Tritrichomonas foetus TaxID=1144522 RepID=A0A1J4K7L8_9EUKA|nr:hypothetical protein TRFO_24311 [Tritrichomonas foetus]|eukprot:OHT07481.1 hypothetical protein TRFO_24311 [Tritrichomonas foetus]
MNQPHQYAHLVFVSIEFFRKLSQKFTKVDFGFRGVFFERKMSDVEEPSTVENNEIHTEKRLDDEAKIESYRELFQNLSAATQAAINDGKLSKRMRTLENEFETIKNTVNREIKKIQQISTNVEEESKEIHDIAEQLGSYCDAIESLSKGFPEIEEKMKNQFATHKQKISQLIHRVKEAENKENELSTQIEKMKTNILKTIDQKSEENMKNLISIQENSQKTNFESITKIENKVNKCEKKIEKGFTKIQTEFESTNDLISTTKEEIYEKSNLDLKKLNSHFTSQITNTNQTIQEMQKQISEINELDQTQNNQIKKLKTQNEELLIHINQNEKSIEDLYSKHESLQNLQNEDITNLNTLQNDVQKTLKSINKTVSISEKERKEFVDSMTISFGEVKSKIVSLLGKSTITIPELIAQNESLKSSQETTFKELRKIVEDSKYSMNEQITSLQQSMTIKNSEFKDDMSNLLNDLKEALSKSNKKLKDGLATNDSKIDSEIFSLKELINEITGGSSLSISALLNKIEEIQNVSEKENEKCYSELNKFWENINKISEECSNVTISQTKLTKKTNSAINSLNDQLNEDIQNIKEEIKEILNQIKANNNEINGSIDGKIESINDRIQTTENKIYETISNVSDKSNNSHIESLKMIENSKKEIANQFDGSISKLNERIKRVGAAFDEIMGDSHLNFPALQQEIDHIKNSFDENNSNIEIQNNSLKKELISYSKQMEKKLTEKDNEIIELIHNNKDEIDQAYNELYKHSSDRLKETIKKVEIKIQTLSDSFTTFLGGSNTTIPLIVQKLTKHEKELEIHKENNIEEHKKYDEFLTNLQAQSDEIVDHVKKQRNQIKNLNSDVFKRVDQVLQDERKANLDLLNKFEGRFEESYKNLNKKTDEIDSKYQRISKEINDNISNFSSSISQFQEDMNYQLQSSKDEFRKAVEESLKSFKSQLKKLKNAIQEIQGDTDVDISTLVKKINEIEKYNSKIMESREADLSNLSNKIFTKIQESESTTDEQLVKLKALIDSNHTKLVDLCDSVRIKANNDLKSSFKSLNSDISDLSTKINDLSGNCPLNMNELHAHIQSLNEESKSSHQKLLKDFRSYTNRITSEIDETTHTLNIYMHDNEKNFKDTINNIQSQINEILENDSSFSKETKSTIKKLDKKLNAMDENISTIFDDFEIVKGEIHQSIEDINNGTDKFQEKITNSIKSFDEIISEIRGGSKLSISQVYDKVVVVNESFATFQSQAVESINKIKTDFHSLKKKQKTEIEEILQKVTSFEANYIPQFTEIKDHTSSILKNLDNRLQTILDAAEENDNELRNSFYKKFTKITKEIEILTESLSSQKEEIYNKFDKQMNTTNKLNKNNENMSSKFDSLEKRIHFLENLDESNSIDEKIKNSVKEISLFMQKSLKETKFAVEEMVTENYKETTIDLENLKSQIKLIKSGDLVEILNKVSFNKDEFDKAINNVYSDMNELKESNDESFDSLNSNLKQVKNDLKLLNSRNPNQSSNSKTNQRHNEFNESSFDELFSQKYESLIEKVNKTMNNMVKNVIDSKISSYYEKLEQFNDQNSLENEELKNLINDVKGRMIQLMQKHRSEIEFEMNRLRLDIESNPQMKSQIKSFDDQNEVESIVGNDEISRKIRKVQSETTKMIKKMKTEILAQTESVIMQGKDVATISDVEEMIKKSQHEINSTMFELQQKIDSISSSSPYNGRSRKY